MKFTNAAGTQEFYNSLERTKSTGIPQGSEGASLHETKRYLNQFGYLKYEDSNNLEMMRPWSSPSKCTRHFINWRLLGSLTPTPSSK